MSKYKAGDKFIIELAEVYNGQGGEASGKGEDVIRFDILFRVSR